MKLLRYSNDINGFIDITRKPKFSLGKQRP